jgi:hypothetical protein
MGIGRNCGGLRESLVMAFVIEKEAIEQEHHNKHD